MTQPQHSSSVDPTTSIPNDSARTDVSLPAPRTRGVSVGIVIALVIAALGIGFAVGRLFGAVG